MFAGTSYSTTACLYWSTLIHVIQQIRASDIWRESEHEGLLDYFLKIKMKGTEFGPPTIKFKGSTDDSQLDIRLQIDYKGTCMNEFVHNIITCAHKLMHSICC